MTKAYGESESDVFILKPNGERLAIFDVSPTIECRWIAIGNKGADLLTVFGSTRDMVKFVAREQIKGGAVTCYNEKFLDGEASAEGFDTWGEYVENERAEKNETA